MEKRKENDGGDDERPWDSLPSLAILNIFCKSSITDRARNLPLVCKSWAHASRHPHCWASMIPDSHYSSSSPTDDAFLKDSYPYLFSFEDPFGGRRSPDHHLGVRRLRALVERAAGGAAVTSLYIFPFLSASAGGSPNDDDILRLIAQCCPNLKHFSFHGSNHASVEAILEVFRCCKKLELVDFSDSPYFNPLVLVELSCCCHKIRGIRRNWHLEPSFADAVTAGFPSLRLLNLSDSTILDKDLLTIVTGCKELRYLDVRGCQKLNFYMYIIKGVLATIAQILYD